LTDSRTRQRGYFRPAFLDHLLNCIAARMRISTARFFGIWWHWSFGIASTSNALWNTVCAD